MSANAFMRLLTTVIIKVKIETIAGVFTTLCFSSIDNLTTISIHKIYQ